MIHEVDADGDGEITATDLSGLLERLGERPSTAAVEADIASNDPDEPLRKLRLIGNRGNLQIDDSVNQFTLPDVRNKITNWDQFKGNVVYLKLFNGL